ncbi:MAG: DUF423 domain-containing protein [Chthonomonas sp.]|nr:DUF423 domain-containing protein [Chthonomonas sp.]
MLAVALGAFGAHALRDRLSPSDLQVFETGVRYHLIHAVALVALGLSSLSDRFRRVGWLFVVGIAVFGGSLYALVLTQLRWVGAVTPIGGVCLILGWGILAWELQRHEKLSP